MHKETVFLEILTENKTHQKWKPIDDNRCQLTDRLALIIDEIDNHKKPEHQLFIDYRYQSINWHRLSSIDFPIIGFIDCSSPDMYEIKGKRWVISRSESNNIKSVLRDNELTITIVCTFVFLFTKLGIIDFFAHSAKRHWNSQST